MKKSMVKNVLLDKYFKKKIKIQNHIDKQNIDAAANGKTSGQVALY